ncbi:hypothetical protein DPMN_133158 [Dreissena polymorpha]|uniref:Uncharacterized protein n=1 Tax=Dreissena polymorpha TaxID=45954 RepID=A0A9D4FXE8_DREPO|nr:hypothetical protein DPMN_133158 [Dreissena polymorpha]
MSSRPSHEKLHGQCARVDVPPYGKILSAAHNRPDWWRISVSLSLIFPSGQMMMMMKNDDDENGDNEAGALNVK